MRIRIAALLALVAVVAIVAVVLGLQPRDSPSPAPSGAASEPVSPSGSPTLPAGEVPQDASSPVPDAAPDGGGQEDRQSADGNSAVGPRTPAAVEPLVSAPLPKTASKDGALVAGFPSRVITVPTGSTVVFSSVASEADRLQVGLNGRSTLAPADVLAHYTSTLTKLGLVETWSPAEDGTESRGFVRGKNSVTVTVTSAAGGSRYTVFGVLIAGS